MMRPLLVIFMGFSLLCGVVYPGVVWGVLQLLSPSQANGSLLMADDAPQAVTGSLLISQPFTAPHYFWGRYSAVASNPSSSGSSNMPVTQHAAALAARARERFPKADAATIPAGLISESASGLDPHISVAAALFQVERVALARGIAPQRLNALIDAVTEPPQLGFLGQERVNVLRLNLLLDKELKR